jgi:thiol-disulfide isomerase/thioredoxin
LIRKGRPFLIAFIATQIALAQVLAGSYFDISANCAALAEPEKQLSGTRILNKYLALPPDLKRLKAPPLEGGVGYLNTNKPISLEHLPGRFVVLDFWTFCCINCMHILPKLAELEQKYDDRLTVVGIHSAKFANEKDTSNISKAILRYGIKHPVVNDANFKIWDAYGVQAWPTLVLIDPEGYIIGVYSGEGHTPEIAALVDKLSPIYSARGSLIKGVLAETLEKQSTNELSFPGKVFLDESNKRLLISDTDHNRIIIAALSEDGQSASVENIIGTGIAALRDGTFSEACFNHPQGICVSQQKIDNHHLICVADTLNHAIRVIDLSKKTVKTIAGNGHQAPAGASRGTRSAALLNSPWDLTLDASELYIAMAGSHQIWRLFVDGLSPEPLDCHEGLDDIAPVVGSGREDLIDGKMKDSALAQPSGITCRLSGQSNHNCPDLFIADAEDSGIREVNTGSDKVTTLIGKGLFVFGDVDGPIASARLQHPLGICLNDDKLYIADSYNHKIKCLDLKTKTIATIAGSGKSGYKDGAEAQFAEPGGLAVHGNKIYVADTNNSVIRVITLPLEPGGKALSSTLTLIFKR